MKGKSIKKESVNQKNKKRSSGVGLKMKLLGVLLPIVICVIAAVVGIVYTNTERIVLEKSEDVLKTSTESVRSQVSGWMAEITAALDAQRDMLEYYDMPDEEILGFVRHTAGRYEAFPTGIYMATSEGKLIHPSFDPGPDFNVYDREWYQEGVGSEQFAFGAVYLDADTQSYVVSVSGEVKNAAGNAAGVVAADIYLDTISDIVRQVQLEETGGVFLAEASTNTVIGHKDADMVGVQLSGQEDVLYRGISEKIAEGQTGISTVASGSGEEMYIDIEQIPDCSWLVVSYVPHSEILSGLSQLTRIVIMVACIGCLILAVLMERLIHVIAKPVKALNGTMASMTDGDFTVEVNVKTRDEIGQMASGVKRFIGVMRKIIQQISQISAQLNGQAEDSALISSELSDASRLQTDSMEELNRTVNELTRSISEVAEMANSLSALVSDTTEQGAAADEKMKGAVAASDHGRRDMKKITLSMKDISEKMDSLEQCAAQMDGSIGKINSIVGLIREIAEETNLLSLNASIEAARAGEAGKGFAVVADQIGKLAGTSKSAVDDIAVLTEEISNIVSQTVQETKESAGVIYESRNLVSDTEKSFEEIFESVGSTNEVVGSMIEKIRDVSEIATSVAGITQEQSAASEEILATAENMRENAEKVFEHSKKVAKDAADLKENAKLMEENMEKFTV